jgi:hypothetical protein
MNFNNFLPQMAIVAREKLTGLGTHVGVLQSNGTVFHTTHDRGPHIVSLPEFAAGKAVTVNRVIPSSEHYAVQVRILLELMNPSPYHLFENNCEIVANRVAGKPAVSPQVLLWLLAGLLGGLALATA